MGKACEIALTDAEILAAACHRAEGKRLQEALKQIGTTTVPGIEEVTTPARISNVQRCCFSVQFCLPP